MENYHQTKEEQFNQEDRAIVNQMAKDAEKEKSNLHPVFQDIVDSILPVGKAFKHGFDKEPGNNSLTEINGYQNALMDVYRYLAVTTRYKAENRYIDSVELLELIQNTAVQLQSVINKEQEALLSKINELGL